MINKEQVSILCEEALAGTDRFLVEVKVKPNNVIEVYVDSDTAVNIDHCAELSRYINEKLDRDVEDYELSVLSWGLSGALKMDKGVGASPRTSPRSTRFPRAADFPIDCKSKFMV